MAHCPNCDSTNLVNVDIKLDAGQLRFDHCRRCEHRWWTDSTASAAVDLGGVLERVAAE
jgi:formate dehydrogenase maturation protein FdhE